MGTNFKNIMEEEKPRERLLKYGAHNISNEDLISIILKTGTKNISVKKVSESIISNIDKIEDLKNISVNKLIEQKGIGRVKAIELIAAIELGKRVYSNTSNKKFKIKNSLDVYNYMKNITKFVKKEQFYVMYLDNKNNIIEVKLLFIGGINCCLIDLREIFKYAYLLNAATFICIHNHPSGDITPSKEDNKNTLIIYKTGNLQGIFMNDHIIMGDNNYYSYKENSNLIC